MIMAIIVIVVLTTIMALTLNLTSQTTEQTGNLYLREQAVLLAKSAAEYAMLAISGQNRATSGCLGSITAAYPSNDANKIFDISITMRYIGLNCGGTLDYIPTVTTPESQGSVLMDVTVTSTPSVSNETIQYFRRTIQKL